MRPSRDRSMVATGICCGVLLAGGMAMPAAAVDFEVSLLAQDTLFYNPSSVGVDSEGYVHIAYNGQVGTNSATREVYYATNATGEWTFTQITDNDIREEFPYLVVDHNDNVHIAFHTGVPEGGNKIRYINDLDKPLTEAGESDVMDITGAGYIIPRIDVDSEGVVHFVFQSQRFGGVPQDVFYTTWSAGAGVGDLVDLSARPSFEDQSPHVAVGPDDVVHITYHQGNPFGGPMVYMNNESGQFEMAPTGVPGNISHTTPAVAPDGTVSIAYRSGDNLRLIDNTDGQFGQPIDLTPPGQFRAAFFDKLAVGPEGHRAIAFANNINDRGLFVVLEDENGFAPPQRFDVETQISFTAASIARNDDGRIAVSLNTSRTNPDNTVAADLHLAVGDLDDPCIADWNGDGEVDINDFFAYLSDFEAGDPRADLNNDGEIDINDFFIFLAEFEAKC